MATASKTSCSRAGRTFWVTGNLYIPTGGRARIPALSRLAAITRSRAWSRNTSASTSIWQRPVSWCSLMTQSARENAANIGTRKPARPRWPLRRPMSTPCPASAAPHGRRPDPISRMGRHARALTICRPARSRPAAHRLRRALRRRHAGAVHQRARRTRQVRGRKRGRYGHRWPIEIAPGNASGSIGRRAELVPRRQAWCRHAGPPCRDCAPAFAGVDRGIQSSVSIEPLMRLASDMPTWRDRTVSPPRQANDPHAWTPKLRLATTRWLSRWLLKTPDLNASRKWSNQNPETLYCTPNGSLRYSQHGRYDFQPDPEETADTPARARPSRAELRPKSRHCSGIELRILRLEPAVPRNHAPQGLFGRETGVSVGAWNLHPNLGVSFRIRRRQTIPRIADV